MDDAKTDPMPAARRSDFGAERRCGDCSLCCRVLRVDPLRKLGGVTCIHQQLDSDAGCAIHGRPERPSLCGEYRCAWLQGSFDVGDRPDRLGALPDFATLGATPALHIREAQPGAYDRSLRLQQIAHEVRRSMPVRITSAADVMDADREYRVLLPGGDEQRVCGERVELWRDGAVVSASRMPLLERWVRRAALAWQRARLRGYRGAASDPKPGRRS